MTLSGTGKWLCGAMLAGGMLVSPVQAARHALLVGVADYPNLPASLQLDGPAHDAEIVQAMLRQRGFKQDNIEQLITAEGKTLPTRENILAALERLAASASEDDFYYLHFAGHGSRQPAKATDNTEPDGLDEIFLPTDAAEWDSWMMKSPTMLTVFVIAGPMCGWCLTVVIPAP